MIITTPEERQRWRDQAAELRKQADELEQRADRAVMPEDLCEICGKVLPEPHLENGQLVTNCSGCGATYTS